MFSHGGRSKQICINCGIELHGLLDGDVCPECGTPVAESPPARRSSPGQQTGCAVALCVLLCLPVAVVLVGLLCITPSG